MALHSRITKKICLKIREETQKGLTVADTHHNRHMSTRTRKLIGTVAFVTGSLVYFSFAISIALVRLPGTSIGTQLLFYAVTTALWLFPGALLIRWMQRPAG